MSLLTFLLAVLDCFIKLPHQVLELFCFMRFSRRYFLATVWEEGWHWKQLLLLHLQGKKPVVDDAMFCVHPVLLSVPGFSS